MDTPSALSTELLDALATCINAGKFKEALELPSDNKYADALKDNCWDIIPFLINKIENDTIITWPALQTCCERLLSVIAERANTEEVLFELLERIETCCNDGQFIALLEPLKVVLKRISNKRGRSLEWCLTSIHTYVEKLPVPENYSFTHLENLLRDSDPDTRRILKIYAELPTFYGHFVKEALKEGGKKSRPALRDVLLCFLVDLLNKPLAVLDLVIRKTKCHSRVVAENIFKNICTLQPDPYFFLKYVDLKFKVQREREHEGVCESGPTDMLMLDEKLPKTGLAVFYYLLLAEALPAPCAPQVYHSTYIVHRLLKLASHLLHLDDNLLHEKGLRLSEKLVALLPHNCSGEYLSHPGHAELFQSLCTIAVYCPIECFRKTAVKIVKDYLFKFDLKGRYYIVVNLLPTLHHAGIKGYIVMLYKEALVDAWRQGDLAYYRGKKLGAILSISCFLPQGTETDLVESADHVISCLNILRYLIIKDVTNLTGIWDLIPWLERDYLSQLRSGIDLSRAHYEARLVDVDQDKPQASTDLDNTNVTINGSSLDSLPPENKKLVISFGLNALDMIDSLFCRLNECINLNKSRINISSSAL